MDNEVWNISTDNKAKIDKDIANYIIEQGEKSLKYSIEVADKTTSKSITLLLIFLPITSTIVGFLINSVRQNKTLISSETILLAYLLIVCIVALIFVVKLMLPRNTMAMGREPKQLVVDQILQLADRSNEDKLMIYKLNEIKNYQYKIDYNRKQNDSRILLFRHILLYTSITAIFGLICYILIVYLSAVQLL
ncbi:hypothetical protein [Pedobacter cryoconitis]|uniref:Uncharacterized protein n=1 Tax=Pedobacter cryoconitis TaxID=188932 RepID=A0A327ST80_9SPHI|nr:hypothetical protein [Pedobacter cryoconitis]RAJ31722.1 hypothetical protein LY11_02222 [Pedobacter cryoconitis]